jgi:DNA ligase (NAD+)
MAAPSKAARRAAALREELLRHDRLYHVEARPEISDAAYDALFAELEGLEAAHPELVTPDSPTQRVGAPLPEGQGFERVPHVLPMLSIESLFAPEDVREFDLRAKRFLMLPEEQDLDWVVEPKYDGASTSLVFERGRFVRGVTRGDGAVGEDITANLRTVRSIPLRLSDERRPVPELLELRGEVLIELGAFRAFNEERAAQGLQLFANPRNAAAGALRRNDPAEVARYPLSFQPWAVVRCEGVVFQTHWEALEALRDWGLRAGEQAERVRGIQACLDYHARLAARRGALPYEADGVVGKLDRRDLRERLGATARATRWQFAYKFAANEASSRLLAVEIQTGAFGRLTPRAHLEPVEIGGVTVRHSTLHNESYVQALSLQIGDRVFLQRAGDVIPQVIGVAEPAQGRAPKGWRESLPEELRGPDGAPRAGVLCGWRASFAMPERCPACGHPVVAEGKYWRCPNVYDCEPQVIGRTLALTRRGAFEIDGLGEKMALQLHAAGHLRSPADVFHLDPLRDELVELERWGEKKVDNLLGEIEAARTIPFERFLTALSIPDVASATARALARHFADLGQLAAADLEELQHVDGVGPEVAGKLRAWFDAPESRALLERLFAGRVRIVYPDLAAQAGGPFAGKTLVFTGTLERMTRAEAKSLVESLGGKVASVLSAKTDYLVTGEGGGGKRKKAEALGVQAIDEARFLELAGRA